VSVDSRPDGAPPGAKLVRPAGWRVGRARPSPPGRLRPPIATARTAIIPRLPLSSATNTPVGFAGPLAPRAAPAGAQGPTGVAPYRSNGTLSPASPSRKYDRAAEGLIKDREALLGAVSHPRTKKPFENPLPKSQQNAPFWMLTLTCTGRGHAVRRDKRVAASVGYDLLVSAPWFSNCLKSK
jgi:hypothetical protein